MPVRHGWRHRGSWAFAWGQKCCECLFAVCVTAGISFAIVARVRQAAVLCWRCTGWGRPLTLAVPEGCKRHVAGMAVVRRGQLHAQDWVGCASG
jgi:hypothetical protein